MAWRRLPEVPEPALPWLYGVARKLIANQLRAAARRRALLERMAAHIEAADPDPRELGLIQAIGRLPPNDREALLLVAWEGLSPAELSVALGCSPAAARARLHRARSRLRGELGEAPGRARDAIEFSTDVWR